jgi:hypothetical protein
LSILTEITSKIDNTSSCSFNTSISLNGSFFGCVKKKISFEMLLNRVVSKVNKGELPRDVNAMSELYETINDISFAKSHRFVT